MESRELGGVPAIAAEDLNALHPFRRELAEYAVLGGDSGLAAAWDALGPQGLIYKEYLTTDEWREYRAGVLARQGGRCATCPRDATHCHHRTYEHLGLEADDDCIGLCKDCHKKLHAS